MPVELLMSYLRPFAGVATDNFSGMEGKADVVDDRVSIELFHQASSFEHRQSPPADGKDLTVNLLVPQCCERVQSRRSARRKERCSEGHRRQ